MLHKLHRVAEKTETWLHVAYCSTLYIEGHAFYATIGGVMGVVLLISTVTERFKE